MQSNVDMNRFSQPLPNGFMMDPYTGDVYDVMSGDVITVQQQTEAAGQYSPQASNMPAAPGGMDPSSALGGAGLASMLAPSASVSSPGGLAPSIPSVIGGARIEPVGLAGNASEAAATLGMGIEGLPGAAYTPYVAPAIAAGVGAHLGKDSYTAGEGKGALKGALAGLKEPSGAEWFTLGSLTPVVGALGGLAGSMFGSGKSKEQRGRDQGRDKARSSTNIYNPEQEAQIQTAKGWFDTRANGGKSYNIDWGRKDSGDAVGRLNPLVNALISQKDKSAHAGLVGEFVNAVQKGPGSFEDNINTIFKNSGLGRDQVYQAAAQGWNDKQYDAGTRDAYFAAIDKHFGIANPNNARWDQQVGLSEGDQKRNQSELTGTNVKSKKK